MHAANPDASSRQVAGPAGGPSGDSRTGVRLGAGANRTPRDGGAAHGEAAPRTKDGGAGQPGTTELRGRSLRPGPCEAVPDTRRMRKTWPSERDAVGRCASRSKASLHLMKPIAAGVVQGLTGIPGEASRIISSPVRPTFIALYVHHPVWSCNVDVRRGSYAARTIGGHTRDAMRRRRKQAG